MKKQDRFQGRKPHTIPERSRALRQLDPRPSRRGNFQGLVICALIVGSALLLYVFRASSLTGDSLNYAYSIKTGSDLFHPHHLLFNPIVRLLFIVISSVCRACDVVIAAQIHNIFWAVVAVLAIFLIIRHIMASVTWGAGAAILLLLSTGFWAYSTQVQVYLPATGCLAAITALLILRHRFVRTVPGVLAVTLLFSLSIFYHQASLFFAIPLGYFLTGHKDQDEKKVFPVIFSLTGVVVLAAYVLAFLSIAGPKTLKAFIRFCLSYAFLPNPDWATLKNISARGIGHLILSQARDVVSLPRQWYVPGAVALGIGLGSLGIWHVRQILKRRNDADMRIFFMLWLLPIYIFLLWYAPGAYELLIVTIFPLLVLFFVALQDVWSAMKSSARRVFAGAGVAFILVLGLHNFRSAVWPAHVSRGPDYDEARLLNMWTPQDSAIFSDWYLQQHLRYYFHRETALEADIPMFCFYRHLPLPEQYSVDAAWAVVISPAYLYPETEISKVVKLNGFRFPSEWLRFMEWLFQFEYDSQKRLISCRSFEIVNVGSGYLALSPTRMNVDGLKGLLENLDAQIRRWLSDPVPHFFNWYLRNPESLGK
jgi:hypothetical protein